jgi:cytochrome d ubiquinol oxidase subunit II
MNLDLPLIWALLIAVAVFAYVVMDGFDLGVGILFFSVHAKAERDVMVNSVAPVWDGNETWLVLGGGGLFAVFPLAYATLLPALYMPLICMLLALIFRGVAFEMRFRARNSREQLIWDRSFQFGSCIAAFSQGVALGGFVQGIKVAGRAYAGGWWDWLSPFSILTGFALATGYALLGACWLIWKTEGELQQRFRSIAGRLAWALLIFIGAVSLYMIALSAAFRSRWLVLPGAAGAAVVPVLLLVMAWMFFTALRHGREIRPFLCALGFFLLSYIGLGVSMWPMMVPPTISIWDAAAPASTQAFLLVGAVVLVPVILIYTGFVYWLFRGKVQAGAGYH